MRRTIRASETNILWCCSCFLTLRRPHRVSALSIPAVIFFALKLSPALLGWLTANFSLRARWFFDLKFRRYLENIYPSALGSKTAEDLQYIPCSITEQEEFLKRTEDPKHGNQEAIQLLHFVVAIHLVWYSEKLVHLWKNIKLTITGIGEKFSHVVAHEATRQ